MHSESCSREKISGCPGWNKFVSKKVAGEMWMGEKNQILLQYNTERLQWCIFYHFPELSF